jgi:creatinine amidohydrolase
MNMGELNWREAQNAGEKIVVVPLGSLEQHGHHLPLLTDSLIGGEIIARAQKQLGEVALFLPMLWLGHSPHHLAFPGSVSLQSKTYIAVLEDVLDSLIAAGFRRILGFNSHGGNMAPASVAWSNVQMRHAPNHPDLWLGVTSWFSLLRAEDVASLGLAQSRISHACEWETSQIAAIAPQLVGDERPAAHHDIGSAFWSSDYSWTGRIEIARRIEQSSASGAFGFPELATPEKGEALLNLAAHELIALVREMATWPTVLPVGAPGPQEKEGES